VPDSIEITLPNGSTKNAPAGVAVRDFVKESIGPGLAGPPSSPASTASRPLTENGELLALAMTRPL